MGAHSTTMGDRKSREKNLHFVGGTPEKNAPNLTLGTGLDLEGFIGIATNQAFMCIGVHLPSHGLQDAIGQTLQSTNVPLQGEGLHRDARQRPLVKSKPV